MAVRQRTAEVKHYKLQISYNSPPLKWFQSLIKVIPKSLLKPLYNTWGAGSAHLVPWFVSVSVAGFNLGAMPTLYKSQIIDKVSVACTSCVRTKAVVFTYPHPLNIWGHLYRKDTYNWIFLQGHYLSVLMSPKYLLNQMYFLCLVGIIWRFNKATSMFRFPFPSLVFLLSGLMS